MAYKNSNRNSSTSTGNKTGLSDLLTRYFHLNPADTVSPVSDATPAKQPVNSRILTFLKPIPWFLGMLFLFSFYWDFNGYSITLLNYQLTLEGLLRIISVSGFIGFLTNWIAITMLFRPLKKRPLLGQGLIPAQKKRISYRLALAVSEDMINPDLIHKKLQESQAVSRYRKQFVSHLSDISSQPSFREDLRTWLINYLNEIVQKPGFKESISRIAKQEIESALQDNLIERAAFKTYTLLKGRQFEELIDEALSQIPKSAERNTRFLDDFLDTLPQKISNHEKTIDEFAGAVLRQFINRLDVQTLVEENLRSYDEQKLEVMIRNATNEQLKTIQYLGAVLGTIGGFVIWEPLLSLGVLGTLFGTVLLLDRMLHGYKST